MTGRELYDRWCAIWLDMATYLDPWDELLDDERNAWAELAIELQREAQA